MADTGTHLDLDLDIDDFDEMSPDILKKVCGTTSCCSEGCANPSCNT